jgi:hypothetical protein
MAFGGLLVVRSWTRTASVMALSAVVLPAAGAGALAAVSPPHRPAPIPSPTPGAPAPTVTVQDSAQEITLDSLGLSAQTVEGSSGSVAVLVPPPATQPAASGNFVRIFFAHSSLLDPAGSSVTVAVNGQPLSAIRLDATNADGSVFEARVAGSALHAARPNLMEARFELKLAGAPATGDSAAYARLEPQTLLHYQLYGPPGSRPPPRLESYPFPLVSRAGSSRVGLILPHPIAEADLRVALRLAADLGRRAPSQQLEPEVVTTGANDWLRTSGASALLVGTIGRLPIAESVLRAAGFSGSASGWTAPDGQPVGPADGLLATVTSPFDGQSPVTLVSGFGDDALYKAGQALIESRGGQPAGSYAVVRQLAADGPAAAPLRPGGSVSLADLGADAAQFRGDGARSLTLPFTAPPVDPGSSGSLQVRLGAGDTASAQLRSLSVLVNGETLSVHPTAPRQPDGSLRQTFSGALIHPGLNTLTLRFVAQPDGTDPLSAGTLTLPPPPPLQADLELLPHPIFSDPGGVLVVVARLDDAVLTAAARGMAALGSRSQSTPSPRVVDAARFAAASLGRTSLIAIGGSGGNRSLEALRSHTGPSPAMGATVQERVLVGGTSHFLLWLDGSSDALLQSAATVLYRHPLQGSSISVDAAGRPHALGFGPSGTAHDRPWPLAMAVPALIALASAALLFSIGLQLWRPLERAR